MENAPDIKLGVAAYGFREYGLREFFEASKRVNLTTVEIDCGWLMEAKNSISVDATEQQIDEVKQLASTAS